MEMHQLKNEAAAAVADDPAARDLLRKAFEKTLRWPPDFKGFTADLICEEGGRVSEGGVTVKSAREATVQLKEDDLRKWVEGQVGMMAVHRSPRSFEESDGKYSLVLGEEDHHPMGRLLIIHGDGMNSRYRIKDDRITQINRSMERVKFTINVEDSLTTPDGKALTTRYTVFYFSPADGALRQVETYADSHAVVNGIYLPGIRRVSFNENGEVITRRMRFEHHRLL
ncbi:MAG: DUF3386 family protein [Nitrospirae bacterium]|nr:DUF3386 family protein [Nitrospirota bacterium]